MLIGKFKLEYGPKIDRAIAVVGDKDGKALLSEYDRLGGYITLNGEKVKNGCFWDYKSGKAFTDPKVVVIKKARAVMEEELVEEDADEEVEAPKKKKKASK